MQINEAKDSFTRTRCKRNHTTELPNKEINELIRKKHELIQEAHSIKANKRNTKTNL